MGKIAALYRYPIKGFNAQPLTEVAVEAEHGFPKDRWYAFQRGELPPDHYAEARPKTEFLMLLRDEQLAALDARFDDSDDDRLSLFSAGKLRFEGSLTEAADVARLEDFIAAYIAPFLREKAPGKPKLLRFPGRQFTDVAGRGDSMMRAVSLINLKSVRALEKESSERRSSRCDFAPTSISKGIAPSRSSSTGSARLSPSVRPARSRPCAPSVAAQPTSIRRRPSATAT